MHSFINIIHYCIKLLTYFIGKLFFFSINFFLYLFLFTIIKDFIQRTVHSFMVVLIVQVQSNNQPLVQKILLGESMVLAYVTVMLRFARLILIQLLVMASSSRSPANYRTTVIQCVVLCKHSYWHRGNQRSTTYKMISFVIKMKFLTMSLTKMMVQVHKSMVTR